jgi:hypothetical protein
MKNIRNIRFAAACICLLASMNMAAQNKTGEYKNSITLQPLYLFNSGLHIDYDRQIRGPHWIQVGVTGYLSEGDDIFETWMLDGQGMKKAVGGGLELNYKYLFPRTKKRLYVAGGIFCSAFDVRKDQSYFREYIEDGLTFYEPGRKEFSGSIGTVEPAVRFAIQTRPYRRFFVDWYAGVGYRFSFYDKDLFFPSDHLPGLTYGGTTLFVGFRLGPRF